MTNEDFKNEYIDGDNYEFTKKINNKNIIFFRVTLFTLLGALLFITYIIINRVFFVSDKKAPKLLLVVHILIILLLYLVYYEIAVGLTNFIVNNTYPI